MGAAQKIRDTGRCWIQQDPSAWRSLEWDKTQAKLLKRISWSHLQPSSCAGVQALGLFPTPWAHNGAQQQAGEQQCCCGIAAAELIATNIGDPKGCREPPAPAHVPAGHTPGSQHQICDTKSAWEGLEGPSARLREDPGSEILKCSQDGSQKNTSRRVCPALKVLFVLQLWLEESSSQTAAGMVMDRLTGWLAVWGSAVTASPSSAQGASLPKLSEGFLTPAGFWAVKAGIKPASPPVPGQRACPAQRRVPGAGQALCSLPRLAGSALEIHDIFFHLQNAPGCQVPI